MAITYKIILNSKEIDIPYKCFEHVWYCYKKRKKYVVRESKIYGIWATITVGVTLDNNWHICEDEFDRIFRNKNEAIDWCLRQNQRASVKVYKLYE